MPLTQIWTQIVGDNNIWVNPMYHFYQFFGKMGMGIDGKGLKNGENKYNHRVQLYFCVIWYGMVYMKFLDFNIFGNNI